MKVDEDRKKEKENEKERKEREREERERREKERAEREERERDDPSDDGRSVLSAGWGAGHDGSAFEKNAAHARTRPNRSQRLAEYAARRAELLCTADSLSAAKPKRTFAVVSLDYSSPSLVIKKAKPKPTANPALSLPSSRNGSTTAVKTLARAQEDANAEPRARLRGCTSPLCPARTSAQLAGRKRRTRPWEVDRTSPPTSRGAGANGSVLGVVWEVPEEDGAFDLAKGGAKQMVNGKGGAECPEKEEQCACLAALLADQRVLKGRTVVCGFGAGFGSTLANGVGFKYDPDVLLGVLFPDPPASVAAGEGGGCDGGGWRESESRGEREWGCGCESGGRRGRYRRGRGWAAEEAAEGEWTGGGVCGCAGRGGGCRRGRRAAREMEEGATEEGEKMAVEEDGEMTPARAPAPAPGPAMEAEEKEEEKETETLVEKEEKAAAEEKITAKEKAKEAQAEKKPRDVHLVGKDGVLLVFSRSAPPSLPTAVSNAGEEVKWDVSRVMADGTREILHRALGKDEVEFAEAGVRFRAVVVEGEEGDPTMPIDGAGEGKSTAYAPWGERTGAVLWRYGS
ncbi:hypothetical protein MVEN_00976500 [Mycena venus]|uniref:Uncharacterized protein n=1 Tax=Mycena venus TaxID=2733690 RepID=A0A8H6YDP8_9AGAR|nr:hypothetical protein MVEN_00976500 [Mycena venus]